MRPRASDHHRPATATGEHPRPPAERPSTPSADLSAHSRRRGISLARAQTGIHERVDGDEGSERLEPVRSQDIRRKENPAEVGVHRGTACAGNRLAGDVVPAGRAPGGDVDQGLDVDGLQHEVIPELDHERGGERSPTPARGPDRDDALDHEDHADHGPEHHEPGIRRPRAPSRA